MEFRKIPAFPKYEVSRCSKVRNIETRVVISPNLKDDGYVHIGLRNACGVRKYLLLHRIVYATWVGKLITGMVVDHDDNNRANCHAINLKQMTQEENINKKFINLPCPEIIHKDGRVLTVTRPTHKFCKEHKIVNSNLCQVMKGTRKTVNGWRLHVLHTKT